MKEHALKTWPEYFHEVWEGNKPFEVRKNDRDYQPGDTLRLQEYLPATEVFTGREVEALVSYVLPGGAFGIEKGFCVLGLKILQRNHQPPVFPLKNRYNLI